MRASRLFLAGLMVATAATAVAAPTNAPQPPPAPGIEITALFFLFPWAGEGVDTLDPIDVNSLNILFDTIDDPDANDKPAHGQ